MGLFNYVHCEGPEFCCSEGHDLSANEFQTKDLGCGMGEWWLRDGRLSGEEGGFGDGVKRPFLGRIEVYTSCEQCPAFVQADTHNLIDCWVEFEVEVVDDEIRSVKRTSQPTADFLAEVPTREWMKKCHGPMPHAEASRLHADIIGGSEVCVCGAVPFRMRGRP